MEEIKLDVQVRQGVGKEKAKKLRVQEMIPGIVYGEKSDPTPVTVNRKIFEKIMREHHGQSVLFHLNILEGEKKLRDYSVILREEQEHPVSEKVTHVDFQRIDLKKEIEVTVQLEAVGDAVGVKVGGVLEHVLWELDVVCLPLDMPEKIVVDVSKLEMNKSIYVKEIVLPKGVRTKHDMEAIAFTCVPPMKEEVAPVATEAAATEPEVIKKKEKEEGAEGKAEAKPEAKPEAKSEAKKDGK